MLMKTIIVGGSDGSLARSIDGGFTWAPVDPVFGGGRVNGIAGTRDGVWVAVGNDGKVARSTDNGATWEVVPVGLAAWDHLQSVATDGSGRWVVAGNYCLVSEDDGLSWSFRVAGVAGAFTSVATDGAGAWLAVGQGRLSRSLNNGDTWEALTPPAGITANAVATDSAGRWVMVGNSGVARQSADNGSTWTAATFGFSVAMTGVAYTGGRWVASGGTQLRASANLSSSVDVKPFDVTGLGRIHAHAGMLVAAGSAGNVAFSESNGLSFTRHTPLGATIVSSVGVATVFMPPTSDGHALIVCDALGRFRRTVNQGQEWVSTVLAEFGVPLVVQCLKSAEDGTWIALGTVGAANRYARSTDNGQTWSLHSLAGTTGAFAGVDTDDDGVWIIAAGVATAVADLWRSTDNGVTWVKSSVALSSGNGAESIATDRGGVWVVGCRDANSLRSTDNGLTWASVNHALWNNLNTVATDRSGTWISAGRGGVLSRSTDNGATWAAGESSFDGGEILHVAHLTGERWIATGLSAKTALSADGGATWAQEALFPGLGTNVQGAPASDGNGHVYVASRTSSDALHARVSNDNGETWSLADAFPSPLTAAEFGPTGTPEPTPPPIPEDEPDDPTDSKVWLAAGILSGYGRLCRSVDGGATWVPRNIGSWSQYILAVASDDLGRWIIVGRDGQMRRSIDNGRTWAAVDSKFGSGKDVWDLATDGAGVWIAVGEQGTMSRSTDHGQTWRVFDYGIATVGINTIKGIATDRAGTWVAVTGNGRVLRSADNGLTWSDHLPLAMITGGGWLKVATDRNGVWGVVGDVPDKQLRSDDNGLTWVQLATIFKSDTLATAHALATDRDGVWHVAWDAGYIQRSVTNLASNQGFFKQATHKDFVSVATDEEGGWLAGSSVGELYRSTDNGSTWAETAIQNAPQVIHAVGYGEFNPDPVIDPEPDPDPGDPDPGDPDDDPAWIAAGNNGKVARSTDDGVTWAYANAGFESEEAVFAACSDSSGRVIVAGENGEMRRSTDNGATWASVVAGFGASTIRCVATSGLGMWVAAGDDGKVRFSADHGATWAAATTGLVESSDIEGIATDGAGTWVAVGRFGDLIRSTNNGATWLTVDAGFDDDDIRCVATDADGVWIAAGFAGKIRRSADNGLTWATVDNPSTYVRAIATNRNGVWVAGGWLGEMLRSTDNGLTWASVSGGFGGNWINSITVDADGVWLVGGDDAYLMRRSVDDGLTWAPVSSSLAGDFVHAVAAPLTPFAATASVVDLESVAYASDEVAHDNAHFLVGDGVTLPEQFSFAGTERLASSAIGSDFVIVASVKDISDAADAFDEISEFSASDLYAEASAHDEISASTRSAHDLESDPARGKGACIEYHFGDLDGTATAVGEVSEGDLHVLEVTAEVSEEMFASSTSTHTLNSAATGDDAAFIGGTSTATVDEAAYGSAELFAHNPGAIAWVLNTESSGVSWYSNYDFTGMAQLGDRVLLVGPLGLCEVSGGVDIDDEIPAGVSYGFSDFGGFSDSGDPVPSEPKKRVDSFWFGYTSDDVLQVSVETYGQNYPAYTYEMEARPAEQPRNNRVRPGKGLNARYWRVGIDNVGGCDFSVDSISADIVPSARRL